MKHKAQTIEHEAQSIKNKHKDDSELNCPPIAVLASCLPKEFSWETV